MLLLLRWLGADTNNGLWQAVVFAITALLAAYGCRRARVAYAALFAALFALLTWLALWSRSLGQPIARHRTRPARGRRRAAAAGAAGLARRHAIGAGETATAGGIAAVVAGDGGCFRGSVRGFLQRPSSPATKARLGKGRPGRLPDQGYTSGLQSFGWDLYLLLVSLALVWLAARTRVRGLGYVGAAGLLTFIISVGLQVTRLEAGQLPVHSLGGWPIVLVVLGALALIVPAFARGEQ